MALDRNLVGATLRVSINSLVVIAAITLLGIKLAQGKDPVLPKSFLKQLSNISEKLLLPCLFVTKVGKELTPEVAKTAWSLTAGSFAQMGIALLVATLARYFVQPERSFHKWFVTGSVFNNAVAMPLILSEAIIMACRAAGIAFVGDEGALDRAQAFVFCFSMANHMMVWTVAYSYVDEREAGKSVGQKLKTALTKRPIIAIVCGICIGLITPVREVFFAEDAQSPLRSVANAAEVLGRATVGLTTTVMAGTLGHRIAAIRARRAAAAKVAGAPEETDKAADGGVRGVELEEAAGLVAEKDEEQKEKEEELSVRTIAGFVFVRTVLVPSLQLGVVIAAISAGIMPADKVMLLVFVVECVTPSANFTIILSQQVGQPKASEALAEGILYQYCVAVVTTSLLLTVGLYAIV